MKIYIGSDHRGFELKERLKNIFLSKEPSIIFEDIGTNDREPCDYPVIIEKLASIFEEKDKAIVICGSGIGMSIAANRYKHIRGALCFNEIIVKLARKHNNANMLILGADFIDDDNAIKFIQIFLNTEFEGGRHANRLELIDKMR